MIGLRQMFPISLTEDHLGIVLMARKVTCSAFASLDFTSTQLARPTAANCDGRVVNGIGKRQLMIDLFRRGTKHFRSSIVPVHVDGAGGSAMF
jgi:hypothetical protein